MTAGLWSKSCVVNEMQRGETGSKETREECTGPVPREKPPCALWPEQLGCEMVKFWINQKQTWHEALMGGRGCETRRGVKGGSSFFGLNKRQGGDAVH